jgi:DNA-directed RNA polymerase
MHAKIKRLEGLVDDSIALIKKLEEENASLRQQVGALTSDRQKIIKNSAGARELEEFKNRVRKKLARVAARIEKTITLQDTLFPEESDDR